MALDGPQRPSTYPASQMKEQVGLDTAPPPGHGALLATPAVVPEAVVVMAGPTRDHEGGLRGESASTMKSMFKLSGE